MRHEESEGTSRAQILAWEPNTAGMQCLGVAQDHRAGQKDTTRVNQACERTHVTGKRPVDDLIRAISRHGDVQSVEEIQNLAKGLKKEQKWRRSHYTNTDLPKRCALNELLAREATAAGMRHLGEAQDHRPGQPTQPRSSLQIDGRSPVSTDTIGIPTWSTNDHFCSFLHLGNMSELGGVIVGFLYNKHTNIP